LFAVATPLTLIEPDEGSGGSSHCTLAFTVPGSSWLPCGRLEIPAESVPAHWPFPILCEALSGTTPRIHRQRPYRHASVRTIHSNWVPDKVGSARDRIERHEEWFSADGGPECNCI